MSRLLLICFWVAAGGMGFTALPATTAVSADTYQNGGYWATAAGWVYWTIRQTDERLAQRLIIELAQYCRSVGAIPEWSTASTRALTGYAASVAAPLAVLNRLTSTPDRSASSQLNDRARLWGAAVNEKPRGLKPAARRFRIIAHGHLVP